jgi:hypothetical protein
MTEGKYILMLAIFGALMTAVIVLPFLIFGK